ncbi:hypothetical protein ACTXT7_016183, partial [Hymenolepis weldensis]
MENLTKQKSELFLIINTYSNLITSIKGLPNFRLIENEEDIPDEAFPIRIAFHIRAPRNPDLEKLNLILPTPELDVLIRCNRNYPDVSPKVEFQNPRDFDEDKYKAFVQYFHSKCKDNVEYNTVCCLISSVIDCLAEIREREPTELLAKISDEISRRKKEVKIEVMSLEKGLHFRQVLLKKIRSNIDDKDFFMGSSSSSSETTKTCPVANHQCVQRLSFSLPVIQHSFEESHKRSESGQTSETKVRPKDRSSDSYTLGVIRGRCQDGPHKPTQPQARGTHFPHRAKFAAFSEENGDELEAYEWVLPLSSKLSTEELRNGIVSQLKHLSKLKLDATLVPVRAFSLDELTTEDVVFTLRIPANPEMCQNSVSIVYNNALMKTFIIHLDHQESVSSLGTCQFRFDDPDSIAAPHHFSCKFVTDDSGHWCVVRLVSDLPKGTSISSLIQPPRPDGIPSSSLETPPEATAVDMERIRVIAHRVLQALAWLNHHSMNHRDLQ